MFNESLWLLLSVLCVTASLTGSFGACHSDNSLLQNMNWRLFFKFLFSKSKCNEGNQNIFFKKWWRNETRFSLLAWLELYQPEEVMLFYFRRTDYSPSQEAETFKAECRSTWLVVKADVCADAIFHVQVAAGKPQDAGDFENVPSKHSEVASKRYARLNTDLRV